MYDHSMQRFNDIRGCTNGQKARYGYISTSICIVIVTVFEQLNFMNTEGYGQQIF